jgi:type III restriction enzyme
MDASPDDPILNSPFSPPSRHWALDSTGAFTSTTKDGRRTSEYLVPIAQAKKAQQASFDFAAETRPNRLVNEIRAHLERWRELPAGQSGVTHETARLLDHWRSGETKPRLFFCQIEAAETIIWLEEIAARQHQHRALLDHLRAESEGANPGLIRIAAKMATGAGKTTVLAMLIAWQAVNAARNRRSFSDAFLVVCPGITIKNRLRVLYPSDPENYYEKRGLVPDDMLDAIRSARVVVTNYHAFKLRETLALPKLDRAILRGRGPEPRTTETGGQMLARVCPELLARKSVVVLNDESHHCYEHRPGAEDEAPVEVEGREEARKNAEAARLWINGIRTLGRKIGLRAVYDVSATPFFLRGSGYPEGLLFPWVVSDFALIDAIESGIVKIPRVPVSDNSLGRPMPVWRNVWREIRAEMPREGRRARRQKGETPDPEALPAKLLGALHALYEHYEQVFARWTEAFGEAELAIPPVFIVVCQNTSHSELLYKYIAGYTRTERTPEGEEREILVRGRLPLFANYDGDGRRLARPVTLLIDSTELDSGEGLSSEFRSLARPEIDAFKAALAQRAGQSAAEKLSDEDLLREVMNTVGKEGRLGEQVRCVVSVSMLTEGWDANTVTHILGVRAFGTELLCEQVVGRGLRRASYDPDDDGMLRPAEYANIFGIPFSFAQIKEGAITYRPPKLTRRVYALPEREALEIRFPRVAGYRVRLPSDRLRWVWDEDSRFTLTPDRTPTRASVEDILGAGEVITLDNWMEQRPGTVAFHVAGHALRSRFRDESGNLKPFLFPQLLRATRDWLETQLVCTGGTKPGLFLWKGLADEAALKIYNACVRGGLDRSVDEEPGGAAGSGLLLPVVDSYNPTGSSRFVDMQTSRDLLWKTAADRCHVNLVVGDSDWELGFCETLENALGDVVLAYVKNHGLGFEVPYAVAGGERRYRPDFILKIDDGRGPGDPLFLVVEIKGYRRIDAPNKREAMDTHWVPAVNNRGGFGRWGFLEIGDPYRAEEIIRAFLARRGLERAAE